MQPELLWRWAREPVRQIHDWTAPKKGKDGWPENRLMPTFAVVTRPKAPNGIFHEVVGRDVHRITLMAVGRSDTFVPTREAVRSRIRRLRPQEAVELDRLDAEISRLREERRVILSNAWTNGHAVTVKELREAAEQRECAR